MPKAREKQSWAVQECQERGLLPELTLQHLVACDRLESICRKDKVPLKKSLGLGSL